MWSDSEKRVKQLIQRLGPDRPPALTDECLALCAVVTDLRRELTDVRQRLYRIETRRDGA